MRVVITRCLWLMPYASLFKNQRKFRKTIKIRMTLGLWVEWCILPSHRYQKVILGEQELFVVIGAFSCVSLHHFKIPDTKLAHEGCIYCNIEKKMNNIGHHRFFQHIRTIPVGKPYNNMRELMIINNAV